MSKYEKGDIITSLDVVMENKFIMVVHGYKQEHRKVYHIGWFSSWSIRNFKQLLDKKCVYVAKRKGELK